MKPTIEEILQENARRNEAVNAEFNPVTGKGSVGERFLLELPDYPIRRQWLPTGMMKVPLVQKLRESGTVERFIRERLGCEADEDAMESVVESFVRLRNRYDFPFWAAVHVYILSKETGEGEILFRLSRPQRKFVNMLERFRTANRPIRMVLLKARQWGGSTTSQLYMAWLQLVHRVGLNSVIISQTKKTSFAIKAMYDRALSRYPVGLLHRVGEAYDANEAKMVNVGLTGDYKKIPQRDCTITIASYESPDALRGDSYSLVHCSEVGLWAPTDMKSPDSVVRSACSGILLRPYTMIIYESTANGTGNFFEREYKAAKEGKSQFASLFISWYDIDLYREEFETEEEKREFAEKLIENRLNANVGSNREEPGRYLWWLWTQGAPLEGIKWYVTERSGKDSHAVMAAEYPTDDIEAFVHSGSMVFDKYRVEPLRRTCRPPVYVGEVTGNGEYGEKALYNLHFSEDRQGCLKVWSLPEPDLEEERITDRYLTVVDIGGRSDKADWSVIAVFDRMDMMETEGRPAVVAQWRGHLDIDQIAWKAAQIAKYYNDSLLVIESNTLETHDRERQVEGDQSGYILNQIKSVYDNLYARSQSDEEIRNHVPVKYGFHTNTKTKPLIISSLVRIVRERLYVERDEDVLTEYLQYERRQNGSYGAIVGHHDDLLMTRAIGLHICFSEMEIPKIVTTSRARRKGRGAISEAAF